MKKLLLSMLILINFTAFSQVDIKPNKVQMGPMTIITKIDTTYISTDFGPIIEGYNHVVKDKTFAGFKTNLDYYYIIVNKNDQYEWRFLGKLTNQMYKGSQVFDQDGELVYLNVSRKNVLSIKPR